MTNEAEDEGKDDFYKQLQTKTEETQQYDILIPEGQQIYMCNHGVNIQMSIKVEKSFKKLKSRNQQFHTLDV